MTSVAASPPLGRIDISVRALERTVAALAASELRVPVGDVRVGLSDDAGALALQVAAPIRLASLRASAEAGLSIVTRSQDARAALRSAVERTTGRAVGRVTLTLTRAVVLEERRVS
jgi:hypothetical protein